MNHQNYNIRDNSETSEDNNLKYSEKSVLLKLLCFAIGIFALAGIISLILKNNLSHNSDDDNPKNNQNVTDFYFYNLTTEKNLNILATDNVNISAIKKVEHISNMILPNKEYYPIKIIILSREMNITDLPEYEFLNNKEKWGTREDGRKWYEFRSLGAHKVNLYAVIDEENLLFEDIYQEKYQEDLLIHELAHSLMEIIMSDEEREYLECLYNNAINRTLYNKDIHYAGLNSGEYFAVSSMAFFNASYRIDINNRIYFRGKLQEEDPNLFGFMKSFYNSSWTYFNLVNTTCEDFI